MADLAQMKARLKELRRKANDPKYPEDLRQQFDQQANDLEVQILRATKGSGMDKKDPEFMKGGMPDLTGDGKVTRADVLKGRGVFKKGGKVPKGMHRMPDGSLMKNSAHKKSVKKMGGGSVRGYGMARGGRACKMV